MLLTVSDYIFVVFLTPTSKLKVNCGIFVIDGASLQLSLAS